MRGMRVRQGLWPLLGGVAAGLLFSSADSAVFAPFSPDLNGFFDGRPSASSALLELPPSFEPSSLPVLAGSERPEAPTIVFHGLELKTFLFSSQPEKIADSLVAAIGRTRSSLWAALYELNLSGAADALIEAKNRGVEVRVIVDYKHMAPDLPGQSRSRELDRLVEAGIPLKVLSGAGAHGIMHNKFAVFDGELLEAGSFNWQMAANNTHYENAIFRDDANLIAGFGEYWRWMWDRAKDLGQVAEPGAVPGTPPPERNPSLLFKGSPWPAFAFSPQGGAEEQMASAIRLCRDRIDIAMFSFTSQKIGDALLEAKKRGVSVRVVMDRSQSRGPSSLTRFFSDNNFDFKLLSGKDGQGVLHHKFGIFDGELLETGSFNYTLNGNLNNFENLVFSTSLQDLSGYQAEFDFLYGLGARPSAEDLAPAEAPDQALTADAF